LLARRQLGHRLRLLRKAAGKTLGDVEMTGLGSVSKLYRLESGQVAVRTGDVRELCLLYGASDEVLDRLIALAKASKVGGWQEDYLDVLLPGFGLYLDLEATATTLQTYNPELIHGLLQSPEYTRVLVDEREVQQAQLERWLEARRTRQRAALDREPPLRVTQILGQAALTRVIGSPEIAAAQLEYLAELNRRAHIDIRVLPWDSGWHPALAGGGFTIVSYAEEADPDFVYVESFTVARYLEKRGELAAYRQLWDILTGQSVPLEEFLR
jgi:transcriptional regulator with XRE-family HTH domain